ncbi:unnamed protein product [Sphenostylis stenocarpa]|uniref:Cucumisin n=1 Tax=Sphenostylis stenocarpa TaxID=92480 RepID=A0AA86VJT6_9FABA|nr:unnamed protein product [Sphenostylis stenocarpa]
MRIYSLNGTISTADQTPKVFIQFLGYKKVRQGCVPSHPLLVKREKYVWSTTLIYMGEYPKSMEFTESLHTSVVQKVLGSKFAPDILLYSYKSFNGFVARLTKKESARMKGMHGVVSIIPNRVHNIQTSRSWDFIGFPENVPRTNIESNTIVGVIDSGIWTNTYSFIDTGFGPPPQKWKGTCYNFTCNNKIIGAKYFRIGGVFSSEDIISPTDTSGHGSHCASTAAGIHVRNANLFGLGLGTARGGAPLARIAVYKVCWTRGCNGADILAAFDEAIVDGVDILSASLGPTVVVHAPYFQDVFAIGAFHAMKRGILTSKSADNLGPNPFTMSNVAPWFISVAATTIDRKFFTTLQLGNGQIFQGVSVNTFTPTQRGYHLIYGGDAPAAGHDSSTSRFCRENSLNGALVSGKIVLCDGYSHSSRVGFASGAAGLIFRSTLPLVVADIFALPAVHITASDGNLVYSYIKSTSTPAAIIYRSHEGKDPLAPFVPRFSSRGPNKVTPDILKPDIAAPGVDILAAWSPISPISSVKGETRISNFSIISGTSMACPHVTAAAVYVKSFHPNWSPAVLKSALMTTGVKNVGEMGLNISVGKTLCIANFDLLLFTATPLSSALNTDAEFAYGAGQINPVKAITPGLVYDADQYDYVKFLCGQGYSSSLLQIITGDNSTCTAANIGSVFNLNLPSFALATARNSHTSVTFGRTVTNVGSATSRYRAIISTHPSSLNIQVVPDVLVFSSLGQKLSFTLKIEGSINADIVSSSLIWDDGTFQARSPIVVYVS